jgi:hypothetical protein
MKKLFFATILYSYLFTLPAMSQTLTEIYETIPDTIIPKNIGDATEVTQNSDSLILFNKGNAKYELAKIADSKVLLLITLPLPEPDTRAYLFNIIKSDATSGKLIWQLENTRDFSDGAFRFAEATITSVSPLLTQVTLREPFAPSDKKEDPVLLKNIKVF